MKKVIISCQQTLMNLLFCSTCRATILFALLLLTPVLGFAQSTYIVKGTSVNVRAARSSNSQIVGSVTEGQKLKVYSIVNDWAEIRYSGRPCYVKASYLQLSRSGSHRQSFQRSGSLGNKYFIGGSVGLSSSSHDGNTTSSSVTLWPTIGYRLNDDWSVGVSVGLRRSTSRTTFTTTYGGMTISDTKDLVTSELSFSPFVRYIFLREGNLKMFFDGSLAYSVSNRENGQFADGVLLTIDNKTKNSTLSLSPGIEYDITGRFSLVSQLGGLSYNVSKQEWLGAHPKPTTTLSLRLASAVSFGLYYYF